MTKVQKNLKKQAKTLLVSAINLATANGKLKEFATSLSLNVKDLTLLLLDNTGVFSSEWYRVRTKNLDKNLSILLGKQANPPTDVPTTSNQDASPKNENWLVTEGQYKFHSTGLILTINGRTYCFTTNETDLFKSLFGGCFCVKYCPTKMDNVYLLRQDKKAVYFNGLPVVLYARKLESMPIADIGTNEQNQQPTDFKQCLEFLKIGALETKKELENMHKESNFWANEYAPLSPNGQNARSLALRKMVYVLDAILEQQPPAAPVPTTYPTNDIKELESKFAHI